MNRERLLTRAFLDSGIVRVIRRRRVQNKKQKNRNHENKTLYGISFREISPSLFVGLFFFSI